MSRMKDHFWDDYDPGFGLEAPVETRRTYLGSPVTYPCPDCEIEVSVPDMNDPATDCPECGSHLVLREDAELTYGWGWRDLTTWESLPRKSLA